MRLGSCVGFTLGADFGCFLMLRGSSYFTELPFHGYLVMLIMSFLHHLNPHTLTIAALVLPPSLLPMTIRRFQPTLGPFKRSKPPSKPMSTMRMPLFVTLSKSGKMSSNG